MYELYKYSGKVLRSNPYNSFFCSENKYVGERENSYSHNYTLRANFIAMAVLVRPFLLDSQLIAQPTSYKTGRFT